MNLDREVSSLLRTVAQAHGSDHIAFGGDTHTRTTTLRTLRLDLLPQMIFRALHFLTLRIVHYLIHNKVDLLQLQIHDIVHQALCQTDMFAEQVKVKVCIFRKRVDHITEEVDAQQAAGVIRTQGNLSARIGAHRTEP